MKLPRYNTNNVAATYFNFFLQVADRRPADFIKFQVCRRNIADPTAVESHDSARVPQVRYIRTWVLLSNNNTTVIVQVTIREISFCSILHLVHIHNSF